MFNFRLKQWYFPLFDHKVINALGFTLDEQEQVDMNEILQNIRRRPYL